MSMNTDQQALDTQRLTLEPITTNHVEELCKLFADERLHTFVPFEVPTFEQQYARCLKWEKRHSPDQSEIWFNWAARLKSSGKLIAHFQCSITKDFRSTIGYVVAIDHQRKGFAAEALQCIFEHLKNQYSVREIKAYSDSRNTASHQLALKMGMKQVDRIQNADFFKGSSSDEFVFSKVF
jgi:ribosomal-protein-alanine N-acetyltransferase